LLFQMGYNLQIMFLLSDSIFRTRNVTVIKLQMCSCIVPISKIRETSHSLLLACLNPTSWAAAWSSGCGRLLSQRFMLPPPEEDDLALEEEWVRDHHIHQKGH